MSSIMSGQKVLSQIVENQLLNQGQIDELSQSLNQDGPTFTEACLTKAREMGWLTRWQTDQIAMGRMDALRFGEFQLTDFLYRGRTSRIFKAKSVVDNRLVSLKVLTSQGNADPQVRKRLQNELEVCKRLDNPLTVKCESIEEFQGRQCLVRAWIEGVSLRQWVVQNGRFDRNRILSFTQELAKGLAAIHLAGFRHGDVHPRHIILSPDMTPVWIDFGFSHELRSGSPPFGSSVPTADFERATHTRSGDQATDAYFFGCLLYELLSGGSPHPELDDDERLNASMLRSYGGEIPLSSISNPPSPEICRTVSRMMDVHVDRRLWKPQEILDSFQRIAAGKSPEAGEFDNSDDSLDTAELHKWLAGGEVAAESPSSLKRSVSTHHVEQTQQAVNTSNVICVECQEEVQAEFRKTFEKLGWRARLVRTAETAHDMVRERAPDLIVFDADGQGQDAIEAFLELDRLASMGRQAPRGLLLLGPKQRKFQDLLPETVQSRYEILQKPLKMRAVKTSLLSCAMIG